jgi:murein DD-endopeptidase MepM/ murein hydrolase activator NlpD
MPSQIDFTRHNFASVIHLPADYEVYDFTQGYDANRPRRSLYGIGRYNEIRQGMYTAELFAGVRNIHMGIDIAAPVGEPIYSFYDGYLFMQTYHAAAGDYGYTLITEHELDGVKLYALYGHLAKASIERHSIGQRIRQGEIIAWVGDENENGGWNPHLHFQLSYERPVVCDMPGAVSLADRARALQTYPDPRLVLGPLY